MEAVLSGLINLGLGGLMAAALVWFLHHLVTMTLPEMNRVFREEIMAERDLRCQEHQALLQMMDRLGKERKEEHEAFLDHVDAGLKELTRLVTECYAALEQRLPTGQPPAPGPRQGPNPSGEANEKV